MAELSPAPQGYLIKLVRDDTPALINPSREPGELWYAPVVDRGDAERLLRAKLMEEATEYVLEPGVAELADVLAVVQGLVSMHGLTLSELIVEMADDVRGGYLHWIGMYGRHEEFDGAA